MLRHANAIQDRALDALHGIKCMQQELREGADRKESVMGAARYARELPEDVARRLTEIDIKALIEQTGWQIPEHLVTQLASDAAFAQVIRAANTYRATLGYAPLGNDGWPVKEAEQNEEEAHGYIEEE